MSRLLCQVGKRREANALNSVPPEEAAARSSGTEGADLGSILNPAACNACHLVWLSLSKWVVGCAMKIPTECKMSSRPFFF